MNQSLDHFLLDHASEILLLVDASTLEIRAANAKACRELGYSAETLIGHLVTDIECALSDVFFWEEVKTGGKAEQIDAESTYLKADGSMLVVSKSVFRPQEAPNWLVIRAHNISHEKQAEEELAHMAAQLRATLEATVDGILVMDRNGCITNMNRRFAQLWQVPDDLLLRHEDSRLLDFLCSRSADVVRFKQLVAQTPSGLEVETFDTLNLCDGRIFECKSRPARYAEQAMGRVFCFTDVTERYQSERALVAARDSADSANRAKGDFLAMMSHEIRTPMNGIIGMAQLLESTELRPEQREFVQTMRSSGEALLAIINDILDYSKIEARKLRLEHTRFSLGELVGDIQRLFSLSAQAKHLDFLVQLSPHIPDRLCGDPVRLRQTLVNLVGNALKFTAKGKIELFVKELELSDKDVRLLFQVRDSGIGIPPDKLVHIFNPFEQADMSTTRRFGGTGLGLSICRMLCELMGGEIGVNSKPGSGSEFWFTVLLKRNCDTSTEEHVTPDAQTAPPLQANHLILIVEDNPVNVIVINKLLRKLGGEQIAIAHDGKEALDLCEEQRFDLIFMDTHMPILDGLEATRALRSKGYQAHIIGVSADAMSDDREAAISSGMNDYITKPVSLNMLRHAIETGLAASDMMTRPDALNV